MLQKLKYGEIITQLEVIDIADEGKSVAKHGELVVFIQGAIPGDVLDVKVLKAKKSFVEAVPVHYHSYSKLRTEPFCSHFGVCGGCKWQQLSYEAQLHFKQKQVEDSLERLAKVKLPTINPIIGSANTTYYRNKLEYTFSNKKWLTETEIGASPVDDPQPGFMDALGFHVPKRFDKIIDIDKCYLQADPSNAIRLSVRDFVKKKGYVFYDIKQQKGFLRNLIIRTGAHQELMVIMVFAENNKKQIKDVMEHIASEFPEVTALLYIVNEKRNDTIFDQEVLVWRGNDHIFEEMPLPVSGKPVRFKVGAKSFYQTNSAQAYQLYKLVYEMAGFKGDEIVYDLYTGAGTIANFIAPSVKKVIGIEYVPSAIEDAKLNSQLNEINNTSFFAGDMKDLLTHEFVNENGNPDVIITDPPRAGMHEAVVARINEIGAEKVVYVSCNPATQARDLALMDEKYEVLKVQPVDMFPHTQHVENIVLLQRRK